MPVKAAENPEHKDATRIDKHFERKAETFWIEKTEGKDLKEV